MKFREHKGSLDSSMATRVTLDATKTALLDHIRMLAAPWPTFPPINAETMHIAPYGRDERIGWHTTYIVTLDDYGVLGFTDGPIT